MIGLEYICFIFKKEYKEIAQHMGISSQAVNSWIQGKRQIPQQRVSQLVDIFGIAKPEYFQKVLTEREKTEIELFYQKNERHDSEYEQSQAIQYLEKKMTKASVIEGIQQLIVDADDKSDDYVSELHREELNIQRLKDVTQLFTPVKLQEGEDIDSEDFIELQQKQQKKQEIVDMMMYFLNHHEQGYGTPPVYQKYEKKALFRELGQWLIQHGVIEE